MYRLSQLWFILPQTLLSIFFSQWLLSHSFIHSFIHRVMFFLCLGTAVCQALGTQQ